MVTLTSLDPVGSISTQPVSIDSKGTIVGTTTTANHVSHVLSGRTDGAIQSFDPPGSIATVVTAMNVKGEIIGYYSNGGYDPAGFPALTGRAYTTFEPPQHANLSRRGSTTEERFVGSYDIDFFKVHGFVRTAMEIIIFDGPNAIALFRKVSTRGVNHGDSSATAASMGS